MIEAIEESLGELKPELKPAKKAQLVITLCELSEEEKQVDKPTLLRPIKSAPEDGKEEHLPVSATSKNGRGP